MMDSVLYSTVSTIDPCSHQKSSLFCVSRIRSHQKYRRTLQQIQSHGVRNRWTRRETLGLRHDAGRRKCLADGGKHGGSPATSPHWISQGHSHHHDASALCFDGGRRWIYQRYQLGGGQLVTVVSHGATDAQHCARTRQLSLLLAHGHQTQRIAVDGTLVSR